jgi:hypothetical protein
MPRLGDDILPSHTKLAARERFHDGHVFDDVALRYGEIQTIITPDMPRSRTKKFIEYDVYCQYRARNKSANGRMYQNCLLANPLGGLADYAMWTLRGEDSATKDTNNRLGKGSKVLILCVNGETTQAVIIGGMRDQADDGTKTDVKDLGHHLDWVFNGVRAFIDKDGALTVTYGGKTTIDGKLDSNVDKKTVGTKLVFMKDGSWSVATADPDDDKKQEQHVFLDHANHVIDVKAKKGYTLTVDDGTAAIKASKGLKVGEATDNMLLGSSYRKAEKQMFQKLAQMLQQAAIQLNAAGATPMAPGATLAQLAAAGALLIQASQAVSGFEQQASGQNDFLSQNNQSD